MKLRAAIVCILVLGGLGFQPAQARDDDGRRGRREHRQDAQQQRQNRNDDRGDERRDGWRDQRESRIDAGEAARRAQQRNGGGRVLGVNPLNQGYEVRLLKQGEVRTLTVPDGFPEE